MSRHLYDKTTMARRSAGRPDREHALEAASALLSRTACAPRINTAK